MFVLTKIKIIVFIGFLFFLFATEREKTLAATLSLTPSSGSFEIGSTFDVSIILNTEGKNINAVKASLLFPPNDLQVVSPSVGRSIASVWAVSPTYDNNAGTINLECGFPNGINATSGLITTITFRVKGNGSVILRFKDDSKVLLDNGKGTDDLNQINNGVYTLILPSPNGPEVISETHTDQSRWYKESSVILKWVDPDPELTENYSYIINDIPDDIPDDIAEGDKNNISYKSLPDGRNYFHIKALNKDKVWGGTTHYAINIDTIPPAEFPVDIFPSNKTSRRNPIIQFITTDNFSGIDHYEVKVVPLSNVNDYSQENQDKQIMFIEAKSPYSIQNLEIGSYDVIVRSYDTAGNYHDSIQKLKITNTAFQFIGDDGLTIGEREIISWRWVLLVFLAIIFFLAYTVWRLKHHHKKIEKDIIDKKLPPEIRKKIEELKRLKEKYKGIVIISFIIVGSLFSNFSVKAEDNFLEINPPLITTISKNISNNEIFYAGGRVETAETKIILYIKNSKTGETFNKEFSTDNKGEWFYRNDGFLSDGEYILWAQSKVGQQLSPPSPQVKMFVNKIYKLIKIRGSFQENISRSKLGKNIF